MVNQVTVTRKSAAEYVVTDETGCYPRAQFFSRGEAERQARAMAQDNAAHFAAPCYVIYCDPHNRIRTVI